jgi:hypothetical protein
MDTDRDFTIDRIISYHFRQKRQLFECLQGNLGQLMMRCRLKNDDRCVAFFVNEKSGFKPIIEFLALKLRMSVMVSDALICNDVVTTCLP